MFHRILSSVAVRAMKLAGIHPRDPVIAAFFGYEDTAAGVQVTENTALNYSAVWAANRIIAETLGSLPLLTYQRTAAGKEEATTHPVHQLLAVEPNPEMTPMVWAETSQAHINLRGNAYSEIEWTKGGEPIAVWPLSPDAVEVVRRPDTGDVGYVLHDRNGDRTPIAKENILHVPGLGYDGLCGYNVIHMARESIGVGLAAEKYGARFFANNARPSGILTAATRLKRTAKDELRRNWEDSHKGLDRAHRVAVLDGGITWQTLAFSPQDAEFLANRKHNLSEIARWFNVPNHMLRDLDRATFSNIEQQSLEFVTYTLRPWCKRWQQELNRKLFRRGNERQTLFTQFNLMDLLVGDILTRFRAYQIALMNGFANIDEVRQREGDNALPDDLGKTYRVPANTVPVDEADEPPDPNEPKPPAGPGGENNNEN